MNEQIVSRFALEGKVVSVGPHGNGHINDTFLVKTELPDGGEKRYILQAVNGNVFKNPAQVMENIERVTGFLRERLTDPRGTLALVPTTDGKFYTVDENGRYWRVYHFVEDALCLEAPETPEDFSESAVAFGQFQRDLTEFPAETLYESIPDFHNTPKRYRDFLAAVEADICGRAAEVQKEIDFYRDRVDFYPVLIEDNKAGKLPLRVTHNDTKINNVMLDRATRKALCVIDLDTIMPGFSVTDFGDSIRFGASTAAEDEKDLSKVHFDLDLYAAYADGYLRGCGGLLTDNEIERMPEGAKMMTLECGMRFLTDYLSGDTYFKTAYAEHNLVRCRTQIRLVEEMEQHWDEMKAIVRKYKGGELK